MQEVKQHITTKPALSKAEGKLVPQLRFKEFDGEWREITLGNLFSFKNGLNSDKEKYGSGIKFINVLDIIDNDVITYDSIIGKVEVTEKELEKNEVIYGDVLFQRSSETREEIGQANVYVDKHKSAVFGGFVIRGRKKEDYDPYYINYLLKTSAARKEITTKSGGSTRYNVGQESLSQVFVYLTVLPEQQKIASFLSTVDKKIQQLTKKATLLEQYKKGVMQQLFPPKGRQAPVLRFKDENGSPYTDWEEKRLGDLGTFKGGGTPTTEVDKYWKGNIPWISSSDLTDDDVLNIQVTRFITEEAIIESATKLIPGNSVLFVSRVGVGKLAVSKRSMCTSQDFANFMPSNSDSLFLAYYFLANNNLLHSYAQGTSIKGFTSGDLKSIKIGIPTLNEQQKIATYLSSIDTKIEIVNQQITQTQTFKKGLLQQMFV